MRISLIKNGRIYNTNLPQKISGSFWIEDKDKNNFKRNLINIEAKDGKWCLKSNFDTKVIYNEKVVDELFLEEYFYYELQVKVDDNQPLFIYSNYINQPEDTDEIFICIKRIENMYSLYIENLGG